MATEKKMTSLTRSLRFFLVCFIWCLPPSVLANGEGGESPALYVDVTSVERSRDETLKKLYVTMGNVTTSHIESIEASFETPSGTYQVPIVDNLNAHQWQTSSIALPQDAPPQIPIIFKYRIGTDQSGITKLLNLKESRRWNAEEFFKSFTPALTGLLGVFAGALITGYLANKKERAQRRFEWAKLLFETFQTEHRLFHQRVSGTLNSTLIRNYFGELQGKALVPSEIRKLAEDFLVRLDAAQNNEARIKVRDEFLDQFIDAVGNPAKK